MRRPSPLTLLLPAGLLLLAGCRVPGGGVVTRQVVVEFVTANSTAARPVVVATCGRLPGVTVPTTAVGDPNVLLDYSRSTTVQFEALTACVTNLEEKQPALHIRDYRVDDGTDN